MRYRIVNTFGENQRIRIVPKNKNSSIRVPPEPVNPTVDLDEAGALNVCLAPDDKPRAFMAYPLPRQPS